MFPELWQDWVLTLGQTVFIIALLPSVFSNDKPHKWSSLLNTLVLAIFAFTFWTLGLYWGAIMSALVAIIWAILFIQKITEHTP